MAPTTTFLYFYTLNGTSPNFMTIGQRFFGPYTIRDDQDGNPDGNISVGSNFTYQPSVNIQYEATLLGFNSAGEPVMTFDLNGGTIGLLSDNPTFSGSFTASTSGVFNVCFASGTLIMTKNGEIPVEKLEIGDTVLTADEKVVPIKWIGRQTIKKLFSGPRCQLVEIKASALAPQVPHTDLRITADHGMIVDGMVINASALVNGDTIDFVPMSELEDSFTVYHIETEAHDVILANGAPSETFIDMAGRSAFDNYQEYLDLYGAERLIPEIAMPRIASARLLPPAIKAQLADKSSDTAKVA